METRANYVAVGGFVLLVLAGIVVAFLWLASAQFETGYSYYDTYVSGSVSGLSLGAPVRLDGIDVGRVSGIGLDPTDPARVAVRMQVRDAVKIHADAVASLETQGLTGVSYVEIAGGTLGAPLLRAAAGQTYPTIASRPSGLQEVFANAPALLARLMVVADRLEALLDDKNRQAIAASLANVRNATGAFAHRTKDIDRLIADGGQTMHNLAAASAVLDGLVANLDRTSGKADRLVTSATVTFDRASRLAGHLDAAVQSARPGLQQLTGTDAGRLDQLLAEANRLAASLDRVSRELERNPSGLLFGAAQGGFRPK